MNKLSQLSEFESVFLRGGAAGDDVLAQDIGQYVGGFYGFYRSHPIMANLPYFGSLFANLAAFTAATQ